MTWLESSGLVVDRHASLVGDTATAVFSDDRHYRYALTRRWAQSSPKACFVMCNPSTADALDDDPTIRRCVNFAKTWNAGGLLVLNLFRLRATDPRDLRGHPDPVGVDNDRIIRHYLSDKFYGRDTGLVVAAWGAAGALQGRGDRVAALLAELRGGRLFCPGVTKDGFPRHPLYVPAAAELVEFPRREAVAP